MRHRFSPVAALVAVAVLVMSAAQPARADNYPVRDGTGASQIFCSKLISGLQYPCHMLYGLFGGTAVPVAVDSVGNLGVNLTAVTDTRSGAATITAADSATTSASGQSSVAQITGTPTANSSITWPLNGHSSATVAVSGTFVETMQLEASADGGTTYVPVTSKLMGSGATTSTVTGPGTFRVDVTGMTNLRLRATAYTSGTATAKAVASSSPGLTQILNPVRLSDATGAVTGTAANPIVTAPQYAASGVTPVTAALTSASSTSTFTPTAGRGFNVSAWGTFVATFQLERTFDSGTTWLPITAAGTQLYQWTAPASEQAEETEAAVGYRVRVTSYTSGTLNVRLSQ